MESVHIPSKVKAHRNRSEHVERDAKNDHDGKQVVVLVLEFRKGHPNGQDVTGEYEDRSSDAEGPGDTWYDPVT